MDAAFLILRNLTLVVLGATWVASVGWTLYDAQRRLDDRDGIRAAMLLALLVPVLGGFLYRCLRPGEPCREARRRALRRDLLLAAFEPEERCLVCRTPLEPEFRCCPVCALELQRDCDACERTIRATWAACPYCRHEQAPSRPAAAPVAA